jgi:hypothetical protein
MCHCCASWFHAVPHYPLNQTFTREELNELTPTIIKRWLCDRAYGDPNPTPDMRPTVRATLLEQMKKAVSFHMPDNRRAWAPGYGGNPTMSRAVNELINAVKLAEVREEGAPPRHARDIDQTEFLKSLELLRAKGDFHARYGYVLIQLMQYHLIGRLDDICKFKVTNPSGHDRFDFALKTKVTWSKNVRTTRHCPDQILFGCMDPDFCVFLHLALYLEQYLGDHPQAHYLFTPDPYVEGVRHDETQPAIANLKSRYYECLR